MMSSIKCEWAPFVVHCLPTVVMLQGFTVLKMRQLKGNLSKWVVCNILGLTLLKMLNDVEFMLSIGAHTKLRLSIPLAYDAIGPVQSLEETSRRKR
jgi:hypothetical protein